MKKLRSQKGFTLAEMLIVLAIISVLVAITMPTLTGQLERARETTDVANIRAAYTEAVVNSMTSVNGTGTATTVAGAKSSGAFDFAALPDGIEIPEKFSVTAGDYFRVTVQSDGTAELDQVKLPASNSNDSNDSNDSGGSSD